MCRPVFSFILLTLFLAPHLLHASDDGPPIAITSPDKATTLRYGSIKSHALIWDEKRKLLIAQVDFIDTETINDAPLEDDLEFRLPGVSFDETKGVFYAVSAKGETIPVARIKKTLFLKSIEVLPNANIRIIHPRGEVTVILEAISPNDPSLRAPPPDTHKVDIHGILQ